MPREESEASVIILDPALLVALAAFTGAISSLIWSIRRKP